MSLPILSSQPLHPRAAAALEALTAKARLACFDELALEVVEETTRHLSDVLAALDDPAVDTKQFRILWNWYANSLMDLSAFYSRVGVCICGICPHEMTRPDGFCTSSKSGLAKYMRFVENDCACKPRST